MVFLGFTVSYGKRTRGEEHLSRLGLVVSDVALSVHEWMNGWSTAWAVKAGWTGCAFCDP